MKWEGNRQSDNVEDHRGEGGGGGGGGFGFGGRSIGIGTVALALLGSWVFGINPMTMLSMLSGGGAPAQVQQGPGHATPPGDKQAAFVKTVLADTEDTWDQLFKEQGKTYVKPKLDMYTGAIQTACGTGQSATGPFYCPGDEKVYIDLDFFNLMKQRFGVSGEFAQAYVIAHEVGHHVQHQLGTMDKVDAARERGSKTEANAMSVRVELQADCYAGVWAYHANKSRAIIEQGDVEGALKAANAIGDDTLQQQGQGQVVPDSFTHGTSDQRVRWFSKGLKDGDVAGCDTFSTRQL
jgi:predicted metalloprotease